ncbi:MAG: thiol:disulfide interchange protein DsbA/DsbL [Burkholderiaceae bacterium]
MIVRTRPTQPASDGRRDATRALAVASLGLLAAPMALAQSTLPPPGKSYRLVKPAQATGVPKGKLEVIEFFWYGCPHCNALEPLIKAWALRLPIDVTFRRVHVPFRERRHQRLYFTLVAMGKDDELGQKVFDAIHKAHDPLDTDRLITTWAEAQGLERKAFTEAYRSFGVDAAMKRADKMVDAYGVDGVPALAVNGKYYTSPSMAGSNGAALQLVDALLAEERRLAAQ